MGSPLGTKPPPSPNLTSLNNTDVPCRDSPPLKPLDRKGPKADVTAEGSETYWERIEEES
jgi:hypothetical protein